MILKLVFILALSLSLVGNTGPKSRIEKNTPAQDAQGGSWQVQHSDVSYEISVR